MPHLGRARSRAASVALLTALAWLAGALSGCDDTAPPSTARKAQSARVHWVETVAAKTQRVGHTALRTGTLEPLRKVNIFNQEEGRITEIAFHEGDRVKRDQVLVRLDDALLRAQLDKAAATRSQAALDLSRLRGLVKRRLAAEDELARADTALKVAQAEHDLLRTHLEYTVIRAPFAGVITARALEPGDIAPKHTQLLTLIDPDSLTTRVQVSELLLPQIRRGDAATVRIDALGQRVFSGRISRIYPSIDPRTRQGTVEILLAPVPEGARAGQLCRVTLLSRPRNRLMVPFGALRRGRDGAYVYVANADNVVRRVNVRTGIRRGGEIEIVDGLAIGSMVVTKGMLGLEEGMQVRATGTSARAVAPPQP